MLGRKVERLRIPKEKVVKRVEMGYPWEMEMREWKEDWFTFYSVRYNKNKKQKRKPMSM